MASLPDIRHPYADYSIAEAVQLAITHRDLCLLPKPTTLQEAREVVRSMAVRAPFNWLTGLAALDLLDAAIDGRDLTRDCRLL